MKWLRIPIFILLALAPSFLGAQVQVSSPGPTNLFNAISATGTQTSSLVANPGYDQAGTFIITWASITGSPLTCTIQVKSSDSKGNLINNGSAFSVSPANGTTSMTFSPASTLLNAPQEEAVYACGTYPSAGTLTLEFVPAEVIYVQGSALSNQSVNMTQVGGASVGLGGTTASASVPVVQATNQGNPCQNPNSTVVAFNVTTSGTTLTQLIALASGKEIFVCSITLTSVSGTTPNYELEYGTATNCGTGTNVLIGPSATQVAGTVVTYPNAIIVPASNALCYKMGVTTPVFNVSGTYVQQ